MSVHYSSAVWKWPPPRDGSSIKLVLLHLADMANHEGLCWPTQARIREETGLSHSTVNRNLTWLETRGLIARVAGNSARNTRYTISMNTLEKETGQLSRGETVPPGDSPTTTLTQSAGDTKTVPPADYLSPLVTHQPSLTVIEPPITPMGAGLPPSPGANGAAPSDPKPTDAAGDIHPAGKPEKKRGGRGPDECFEALVEIQGSRLNSLTRSERGAINRALGEIRRVMPDVTAATIRQRAETYREKMPRITLTANALASWWGRLGGNGAEPSAAPVVSTHEHAPPDWRDACAAIYEFDALAMWPAWTAVPPANRREICAHLRKKKKGGGDV